MQDTLSKYIRLKFDDLHFSLLTGSACQIKNQPELKPSPVRIYEIENRFYIVGVFDIHNNELKPGTEVFKIDSKPIHYVLDSISKENFQQPYDKLTIYKQNIIIQYCLNRPVNGSCILQYKDSLSILKNIKLSYDKPLKIPENFKSKQFTINSTDSISYLRIGSWTTASMLEIFNNWDILTKNKALIIDLRGNGGGDTNLAMQLFSLFINKSADYLDLLNIKGITEHLIIKPNNHYQFNSKKKILMIADYSTACASESFIRAMKTNYKNCMLIGSSSTYGTLSLKYDQFTFRCNFKYKFNLWKFYIQNRSEQIEYKGISPDFLVKTEKIDDLKPYHDKVLLKAYEVGALQY